MYENLMIFLLRIMKENCKIFTGLVKNLSVGSEINVFCEVYMYYSGCSGSALFILDNAQDGTQTFQETIPWCLLCSQGTSRQFFHST